MILNNDWKSRIPVGIGLAAVLLITAVIYWPGLNSRFLGDDYVNLSDLDSVSEYGYLYYIFGSGNAGPSGRPISLASFALQHNSWPDSPFDFKLVNLIIHLANGCLIFFISQLLAGMFMRSPTRVVLPSMVTAMWLLHPMLLTTTLYAVQRMTLLSAFFTLAGILVYVWMRRHHQEERNPYRDSVTGILIMVLMTLAIFSKENGILLPVYILSLEHTLLRDRERPGYWTRWEVVFLLSPIACLLVYLGLNFNAEVNSFAFRGYSMSDRILTEIQVLVDYLRLILLPKPDAFSLDHDAYRVVTSAGSVTFIVSAVILTALVATSIYYRKKLPVYSFAIFWFLGGHFLESTYLNLELYFEHRNYLPLYGIVFFVVWGLISLADRVNTRTTVLIPGLAYIGIIISITVMEVGLWANPSLQIVEWARNNPESIRANQDLFKMYESGGDYQWANNVNETLKSLDPGSFYPYVKQIQLHICKMNKPYTDEQWTDLMGVAARSKPSGLRILSLLDNLSLDILKHNCQSIDIDRYRQLLTTLINNKNYNGFYNAMFYDYLSSIEVFSGNLNNALAYLKKSDKLIPELTKEVREIKFLYALGRNSEAEIKKADVIAEIKKRKTAFIYNKMIKELEQQSGNL